MSLQQSTELYNRKYLGYDIVCHSLLECSRGTIEVIKYIKTYCPALENFSMCSIQKRNAAQRITLCPITLYQYITKAEFVIEKREGMAPKKQALDKEEWARLSKYSLWKRVTAQGLSSSRNRGRNKYICGLELSGQTNMTQCH